VRYIDDTQDVKKEGLFGKLLTSSAPPKKLVVNVRPKSDSQTQVSVVDASGNIDTSADAKRLVSTLGAALTEHDLSTARDIRSCAVGPIRCVLRAWAAAVKATRL